MTELGQISGSAQSRHVGVAIEGHCRALLSHALLQGQRLTRDVPFPTVANPDAVVLDEKGAIACIAIIAMWSHSGSSEKKYYRTLSELNSIRAAWQNDPRHFSKSFLPITVIYGTASGWKARILTDMEEQCPLFLFLPAEIGEDVSERLMERAFDVYAQLRPDFPSTTREEVERYFGNAENLNDDDQVLLELFRNVLADREIRKRVHGQLSRLTPASVPSTVTTQPFQSRYRQGLALASLFAPAEIDAWLAQPNQVVAADASPEFVAFTRRAFFLDLVSLQRVPRIGRVTVRVEPRRPVQTVGNRTEYAAHRPDFDNWTNIGPRLTKILLDELKQLAGTYPTVFAAAARDLAYGNWGAVANAWAKGIPRLEQALRSGRRAALISALDQPDQFIGGEPWQLRSGEAHPVVRQVAVAALATSVSDRRQRNWNLDSSTIADALLAADRLLICQLLEDTHKFIERLQTEDLEKLTELSRPALLSLDNSSSWATWFYSNITTNSTYNPLAVALRTYLRKEFNRDPIGWPAKRSVGIKEVLPEATASVQWGFAVPTPVGRPIVLAEVKSVTANHWGDKSKEIYARAWLTRQMAEISGRDVRLIGVLDGDVDAGALSELSAGLGYDVVLSARELLIMLANKEGVPTPLSAEDNGE